MILAPVGNASGIEGLFLSGQSRAAYLNSGGFLAVHPAQIVSVAWVRVIENANRLGPLEAVIAPYYVGVPVFIDGLHHEGGMVAHGLRVDGNTETQVPNPLFVNRRAKERFGSL
jgi:hypothetical protein